MGEFAGMRHLETATTTAQILAGRRVRDVSDTIALLDQNNTTLVTLLMKLRKKKCTDPKFEWGEDVFLSQSATIGEHVSSTETGISFSAADAAKFREGDVWWYPEHDDVVFVDSVVSTVVTFVKGVGETTPAQWDSGDELYYIGNAQATGDTARAQLTTQTTQAYNYAQLFKEPFEVDRTAMSTKLFGGPDMSYLIRKHGEQHKRDIERAFWFGERDDLTGSDSVNYVNTVGSTSFLTRGVWHWASASGSDFGSHTNSSGTELTEDEFNGYLETDFRYGNGTKFLFASPRTCTVIDGWGRDKLQLMSNDTTAGMVISRYKSTHGSLNVVKNNLFADISDSDCATNPATAAILLDLEQLWYRYLNDTELEQNIQENDRDAVEHQYRSECGLELRLPAHHSGIYGWST